MIIWIILFISALSFLGLGVQPPMSDWGSMVKENLGGLPYGSIAPLMPSLAIATLTISINLIVDDISAHTGGKLSNRMICWHPSSKSPSLKSMPERMMEV